MELRILGPVEVWGEGPRRPLSGSKRRALLAVLLLDANEVVGRDVLEQSAPGWGPDRPTGLPFEAQAGLAGRRLLRRPRKPAAASSAAPKAIAAPMPASA
jgi:hypothetical protein